MAIHSVRVSAVFDNYEDRKAVEEQLGRSLGARVSINKDGTYRWQADTQDREYDKYFFVSEEVHKWTGLVVDTFSRTERIMSDVWAECYYARVWDPNVNGIRDITLGNSEFGGCGEAVIAEVDAPADILEAYQAWKLGRSFRERLDQSARSDTQMMRQRRQVDRGKWVKVVRGRKVKKGTIGFVFWTQEQSYGYWNNTTRIGIAVPDENGNLRTEKKVGKTFDSYVDVEWTYAKNCVVIDPKTGRVI